MSDVETSPSDGPPGEESPGWGTAYASTRRVFRIIDTVSRSGARLTAKKLAHDLGTSLSTCYHLLGILLQEGYIEKIPHQGGYRLGPAISLLNERNSRSDVASVVEPVIRELSRQSARQACLAVLSDGEVELALVETPPESPPVGVARGLRGAGHALAVGKVLVASTGIQGISAYLQHHRLEAFTARTITDPAQLEAHLKRVRFLKLATDLEEFAENLFDVAVPLETQDGVVRGAIGVFTTARRSSSEVGRLVQLAQRAAQQGSDLLSE
jgi:IclR family transcriptional regulator, acetate operon repressor